MRDFIYIDTSPVDEPCAQVGKPDYWPAAQAEYSAFQKQLIREIGELPFGCNFRKRDNHHDAGTYLSMDLWYPDLEEEDPMYDQLWEYINKAECGLEKWDEISIVELKSLCPDYFDIIKRHNEKDEAKEVDFNPSKKHLKIAV